MEDDKEIIGNGKGESIPEPTPQTTPNGAGQPPGWPPQPTMPPPQAYPPQMYYQPPPKKKSRLSNKPHVVGTILAAVAILGFIGASFGLAGFSIMADLIEDSTPDDELATITGKVTYLNGTGIEGVQVTVVGEALGTVTDAEGYYIIYEVPTGNQRIQATMDGFTTITRKVTVNQDVTFDGAFDPIEDIYTDVHFTMSPGDGSVEVGRFQTDDIEIFKKFVVVCATIGLIASALTAMGAYFAFKRANPSLVVIGAVAGIFTFGFFVGSILAFVALFILLLSLDEFRPVKEQDED
jgi:hypothetical protein